MKKTSLLLLTFSMCFFACKKDDHLSEPGQGKDRKFPVSLDLSAFIQQTEAMSSASGRKANTDNQRDSALRNKVTDIYYLAFDPYGNYAGTKHQHVTQDSVNFGHIKDTLYSDTYTVFLLAANTEISLTAHNLNTAIMNAAKSGPDNIIPFKDVFYKKVTLNVGKGTYPPQDLTLSRIVGNLQVEVLDANVNSGYQVSVMAVGESRGTFLQFLAPSGGMFDSPTSVNMSKISGTTFSNNFMNTTSPLTVTITAKNNTTGDQIQRVIENVVCYKNKKTTITGSLNIPGAPQSNAKEFKIAVNDTWDPNDSNINF